MSSTIGYIYFFVNGWNEKMVEVGIEDFGLNDFKSEKLCSNVFGNESNFSKLVLSEAKKITKKKVKIAGKTPLLAYVVDARKVFMVTKIKGLFDSFSSTASKEEKIKIATALRDDVDAEVFLFMYD
jgi:hypothetical protein